MRGVWSGYVAIESNELFCFENVSNISAPVAMACSELESWNLKRFSMIYAESLLIKFFTSLWRINYMYLVCGSFSSTICILPLLPLPGWPSGGGSLPIMRAWPSSWFCFVSRLVIRFKVILFMSIHQWTHKIPVFSHSLNNKSSNTVIRIPGSTHLEYKHRGKIEGKKKIQLSYSRKWEETQMMRYWEEQGMKIQGKTSEKRQK